MTGQEAAANVASSTVKRLLAAVFGLIGIAWWRKRAEVAHGPDPADELRAKLAEAREAAPAREEDEAAEVPVDEAPDVDVATRRSEVHDRARQAIDDLSSSDS
jgi:hypothetical protein